MTEQTCDRCDVSIHAPLRREERRKRPSGIALSCLVSIHAPLRREERRAEVRRRKMQRLVSIHAPLRREERQMQFVHNKHTRWFQSTPPSGERSDVYRYRRENR